MTDKKKNSPRLQSNTTSSSQPEQLREHAEQRAKATPLPDLDTMTREQIQDMVYEMQVKHIEAGLQNEHLLSRLEEKDDQASLFIIVIENMLDMVAMTNMEGNYIFAGKSHENLGYEPGSLIGKNVMDFVHPEDRPGIMKEFAEFVSSGHPRKVEYRNRCEDGTYLWFETLGNFIRDENGSPQKIVFSSRDITTRKQAEESFHLSHSLLSGIIESSPHGIFSLDREYRYTSFNRAHAKSMKRLYNADIQLGRSFYEYQTVEADRQKSKSNMDRALKGEQFTVEAFSGREDLSRAYISVIHNPIRDKNGNIIGVSVFANDITEQKEDQLIIERVRYSVDNVSDSIFWVDDTGRFIDVNEAACNNLGYTREELMTMCVADIDPCFSHESWQKHWEEVTKSGLMRIESIHQTKEGLRFPVEASITNQKFGGKLYNYVVAQDITERKQAEMALRESEQRYRNLYENAPAMMYSINCNGEIVDVSNAWLEKTGYTRAEVLGCKSVDFLTEESHKVAVEEHLPKFYATGSADNVPYQVVSKNGRIIDVLLSAISEKDNEGGFLRSIAVMEDITERKKAEMAWRESEQRFKAIIENLPGAVFAHDLEGRLLFVNKTASANSGYSEQELLAMTVPDIDSGHFAKDDMHQLWHSLNIGESKTIQSTHTRKNGSTYPVEIHLNAISLDNQPIILPIAIDITERKKAENEIAEQHSLIEAIYSNAPLIMMVVDSSRRLRQVNGFATQFTGLQADEMLGLRGGEALRCIHAFDDPRGCGFGEVCNDCLIRNKVLETLEYGVANLQFEASFDFSSDDGTQSLTLLVSTTPIPFQGETMALLIIMDITERKQAEKEKEKLQSQLNQAQKMESVGRLAGGVAHDFNNKLTIINGYAEMAIEMMDPSDPLRETIHEIHTAGKQSAAIVRQLLAFARKQTISPVQLDLNDSISNMLKMLQRLIGENIDLVWHPGNNLWPVKIDPSQVDQIMVNLAINARDAIADVGKITIETNNIEVDEDYCTLYPYFVPGQYVMLAVSDDGSGMDKHVVNNLFEPFFTTKDVGKGTGLGLPTVYGIVKQNKGFVNVYSETGEGTTFKLYFPFSKAETVFTSPSKETKGKIPMGSETILIVEDEPAILKILKGMVERLGYNVLSAERPDAAVQLAAEHDQKIDLLITDVVMPEMNGRDLASKLTMIRPGLKTLYMSGYTANAIAHNGVLDEDVLFIQKPFSMQDLAAKVRKAIEQG